MIPTGPESGGLSRVLVIDDNRGILDDFAKILGAAPAGHHELESLAAELFGETEGQKERVRFDLETASQGKEGFELVLRSIEEQRPFSLSFVDVRMPPGWDGIETVERIWQVDPAVQVVLCTAFSDHDWDSVAHRLGRSDSLLVLKKPFETIEVLQLARALTRKWVLQRELRATIAGLETTVQRRTSQLAQALARAERESRERAQMEISLRLAQKMEALGRLSSGIAHEINTPVQFVGDSLHFAQSAFGDLTALIARQRSLLDAVAAGAPIPEVLAEAAAAEAEADLPYLREQVPGALARAFDGLGRVASIVRSLKEFGHPDRNEMAPAELNHAIETTLTVARSEYKHIAEVETVFAELPLVTCHIGDINQVVLNLVVNAAHAIADARGPGLRGHIRVATRVEGDDVVISVQDDGGGIPEEIRERIFDPFFTTKEVGRGTGQGLAIVRTVVGKHGGTIHFDTELGKGTTFEVVLPIKGARREVAA